MSYEDQTVVVDSAGLSIQRYGIFGGGRRIEFSDVESVSERPLGFGGRWRVAGAGPGSGGRNWYGWDGNRRSKPTMFMVDTGGFWRPTVTPEDPDAFREALPQSLLG